MYAPAPNASEINAHTIPTRARTANSVRMLSRRFGRSVSISHGSRGGKRGRGRGGGGGGLMNAPSLHRIEYSNTHT